MIARMTLRKLLRNKGLAAALLMGFLLAAAMVAIVPLYTQASLQRTFLKEMEAYQQDSGVYPGTALASVFYNENELREHIAGLNKDGLPVLEDARVQEMLDARRAGVLALTAWADAMPEKAGVSLNASVYDYATTMMQMEVEGSLNPVRRNGKLHSLTGLAESAQIVEGRFPQATDDGVFEVMASRAAMANLDLLVGQTLSLRARLDLSMAPIRVRVVGVFGANADAPYHWGVFSPDKLSDALVMRWEDMQTLLLGEPMLVSSARFYFALNYQALTLDDLAFFSRLENTLEAEIASYGATVDVPATARAALFRAREASLRGTMWMLNLPVLALLLLYLTMVSRMIVQNDSKEMAMLCSRGAGRLFVGGVYCLYGALPACVALAFGLPLAGLMCRVLGASNGFLSFVNRAALPVRLTAGSWAYCAAALVPAVLLMALPAMRRADVTVATYQRLSARKDKPPVWRRFGLDFALLALTAGLWALMTYRPGALPTAALYGMMPVFGVGAALLFLRVYPFAVRLVYAVGKRRWKPPAYMALLRVSRNPGEYRFLMLFLILTVSVGLFSASAARTLGQNESDQIDYAVGADMVLTPNWPRMQTESGARVQEPSFLPYSELPGVEHAAKALRRSGVRADADGGMAQGVEVVGIEPASFGLVAWTRDDLLPVHVNHYLNALTLNANGCVLSYSLSRKLNVSPGDFVTLTGEGAGRYGVLAVAEYWPGQDSGAHWAIVNLAYMQDTLGAEPYEIWLRMREGAPSQDVYDAIIARRLPIIAIEDARQLRLARVLSADRLAVNGAMTLGFLVSCAVCMLGLLLYWLFYLRAHRMQFGLQRGMGLTLFELIRMILWEQTLTAIVAILVGVGVGALGSRLFVPFFLTASGSVQYIPLRFLSFQVDRMRLYGVLAGMLVICWAVLAAGMARMKVAQAIKLGEDEA